MHWLEQQVRKSSQKQMIVCVAILAAVVGGLAFTHRYLMNYFSGPYAMTAAELVAVKDADALPRYWIKTTPERLLDTGIDHISVSRRRGRETGRSVTGHYYAGVYGDRLMIIKTEADGKPSGTLEGALKPVPENIVSVVLQNARRPELRSRMMPVMLDTASFTSDGNFGLAIAAAAAVLALGFGVHALGRHSKPGRHPALVKLAATVDVPLTSMSRAIEADLQNRQDVRLSGYQLAGTHLLKTGGLTFDARSLGDLVWAYPEVTKKKIYYVIPAGTTHAAVLHFRKGQVTVNGTESNVQNAMRYVIARAPWALVGYDDKIAAAMKAHIAEVHAAVDARKAHVAAAAAGQQPDSSARPV